MRALSHWTHMEQNFQQHLGYSKNIFDGSREQTEVRTQDRNTTVGDETASLMFNLDAAPIPAGFC